MHFLSKLSAKNQSSKIVVAKIYEIFKDGQKINKAPLWHFSSHGPLFALYGSRPPKFLKWLPNALGEHKFKLKNFTLSLAFL